MLIAPKADLPEQRISVGQILLVQDHGAQGSGALE
jgi:hypothetical protein